MEAWEKKVERIENNPRRRAKESKVREYYEKQFPEIRKQRELQERMQSRVGQRGSGLSMSAARSEHEVSEIIDGLSEQENLEKQMRQLAVIPPMLYDADQQRIKFINMNGLMDDPMKVYKDRQVMNMWSEQEKETFREKFMQHPKNFGVIASFLDRKIFLHHWPGIITSLVTDIIPTRLHSGTGVYLSAARAFPKIRCTHSIQAGDAPRVYSANRTEAVEGPQQLPLAAPDDNLLLESSVCRDAFAFPLPTVADCVLYYYLTKKNENYKNLVRRNYRRRGKNQRSDAPAAVGHEGKPIVTASDALAPRDFVNASCESRSQRSLCLASILSSAVLAHTLQAAVGVIG
ncbi:UNVERIFIED_CONTAM: nuclear receptor corepressor 2 [Gekko kuhli]